MADETVPAHLRDAYADWRWTPAWTYGDHVTVWRIERGDEVRFAKVGFGDPNYPLTREAAAMQWAGRYVSTPTVVDVDPAWLVTDALPGRDATNPQWASKPEWIVPVFARGLRAFHDALPVDDCPFRLTIDDAFAICRGRIESGTETIEFLHDENKHLGVQGAYDAMVALRPSSEDLVVCHGDYCFPNVLIEDEVVTGYIDLGELNVADRWWDIAIGMWSTTWNVGPGYEELFAASYGVDIDDQCLRFYRLMYDLIS